MNAPDHKLAELLRTGRSSPDLPPHFQANVWRRIGNAETSAHTASRLDALVALILRPRFALAAAVILLALGALAGTMEGRQLARHDAQMNYLASVAPHSVRLK